MWTLPAPTEERPDHLPPLCDAAVTLATRAHVDAILAITREGRTARLLSARRPRPPIYAITDGAAFARQLALWWGVHSIVDPLNGNLDDIVTRVVQRLRDLRKLPSPALVAVVSSTPDLDVSASNFVRLRRL